MNLKEKTTRLIDQDNYNMVKDVNNYLKQVKSYDEKKSDIISCVGLLNRVAE